MIIRDYLDLRVRVVAFSYFKSQMFVQFVHKQDLQKMLFERFIF